jgi:hypothetical protein
MMIRSRPLYNFNTAAKRLTPGTRPQDAEIEQQRSRSTGPFSGLDQIRCLESAGYELHTKVCC